MALSYPLFFETKTKIKYLKENKMITINKNSSNTAIFYAGLYTTKEYFTWCITHQGSGNSTYFTGTDVSGNKELYNKFTIIETGSTAVNLTASTLSLQSGMYDYEIKDNDIQSLEFTGTTVEYGLFKVISEVEDNYVKGELNDKGRTKNFLGKI